MTAELSLVEIKRRVESIPGLLEEQLRAPLPDVAELSRIVAWDVVGIGASEGPAKLLNGILSEMGIASRLLPLSGFRERQPPAERPGRKGRGLVIFSQGLSPNAQLALQEAPAYERSVLFTAVDETSREERARLRQEFVGTVVSHGPHEESGSLVRFAGPMVASLAAVRFCLALSETLHVSCPWSKELVAVPDAYRRALSPVDAWGTDPSATLAVGADLTSAQALMWKWQEALYTRLPPTFDVLSFAHGPLQAFFEHPALFVVLERPGAAHGHLWSRLDQVLHPERHRVVRLCSSLPGPLAGFEFDALLNARLLSEMKARNIDPARWPGQEVDGPLYSLCVPPPRSEKPMDS